MEPSKTLAIEKLAAVQVALMETLNERMENERRKRRECVLSMKTILSLGILTPSMNGNREFKAPRSLKSQAGPSHWDVCSCWRDLILLISL
jgi:hypothetical protein